MSKDQKKLFKSLKKSKFKTAFIEMLKSQQQVMGGYDHWLKAYTRKADAKPAQKVADDRDRPSA